VQVGLTVCVACALVLLGAAQCAVLTNLNVISGLVLFHEAARSHIYIGPISVCFGGKKVIHVRGGIRLWVFTAQHQASLLACVKKEACISKLHIIGRQSGSHFRLFVNQMLNCVKFRTAVLPASRCTSHSSAALNRQAIQQSQ
jgi:hypothetical protein